MIYLVSGFLAGAFLGLVFFQSSMFFMRSERALAVSRQESGWPLGYPHFALYSAGVRPWVSRCRLVMVLNDSAFDAGDRLLPNGLLGIDNRFLPFVSDLAGGNPGEAHVHFLDHRDHAFGGHFTNTGLCLDHLHCLFHAIHNSHSLLFRKFRRIQSSYSVLIRRVIVCTPFHELKKPIRRGWA